jgi:hypothetical protein
MILLFQLHFLHIYMHIIRNNLPKFVGVYDVDIIKLSYTYQFMYLI